MKIFALQVYYESNFGLVSFQGWKRSQIFKIASKSTDMFLSLGAIFQKAWWRNSIVEDLQVYTMKVQIVISCANPWVCKLFLNNSGWFKSRSLQVFCKPAFPKIYRSIPRTRTGLRPWFHSKGYCEQRFYKVLLINFFYCCLFMKKLIKK